MEGLPSCCFPSSAATDKLAGLREKARKKGQSNPFPFMDLREFLPSWADEAPEAGEVELCADPYGGVADPAPKKPKTNKRLDMVKWFCAYEGFAIAAHAAEVCIHVLVDVFASFASA